MLLQIVWMIATSAASLAISAAAFYTLCYLTLLLVRIFPMIGRRHRHRRWDELNDQAISPNRQPLEGRVASAFRRKA